MPLNSELRDFISAFSAGRKMFDDSPERLREAYIGNLNSLTDYRRGLTDKQGRQAAIDPGLETTAGEVGGRVRGQAIPAPASPAGTPTADFSPSDDRDAVVRTVLGEAAGEGPQGWAAVAHSINNRLRTGRHGKTLKDVVLQRGQYEPWLTPEGRARMARYSPDSPEYKSAAEVVDKVLRGEVPDPTRGMTHFYAPKAQAALGRSKPAWAKGLGQTIGGHSFYAPDGAAGLPEEPVQEFEDGGLVEDETGVEAEDGGAGTSAIPLDEGDDATLPSAAAPTQGALPQGGLRSFRGMARQAVQDGMLFNMSRFGLGTRSAIGAADPARAASTRAYLTGAGAAPNDQMEQVRRIVDPQGTMTESERNLAALGAVYEFHSKRGDAKKAQAAAAGMLQYFRMVQGRFAAISQAHAEAGDIDGAVKNALRAYAQIPDGRDIKIVKQQNGYGVEITDTETGRVTTRTILSPQQMGATILGWSPGEFDKRLMAAAGVKPDKGQAAGPTAAFRQGIDTLGGGQGGATPTIPGAAPGQPSAPPGAPPTMTPVQPAVADVSAEEDTGEDDELPAGAGLTQGVTPQGNTQNAAPQFDADRYSQMNPGEQRAYMTLYNQKVKAWQAANKPAKGGGRPKPNDVKVTGELIQGAWDAQIDAMTSDDGKTVPKFSKAEALSMRDSATDILTHGKNARVTPQQAVQGVLLLTAVDKKNPDSVDFKATPEEGGAMIRFRNGRSLFVPKETLVGLATVRAANLAEVTKQKASAEASAKRWKENIDAVVNVVGTDEERNKRAADRPRRSETERKRTTARGAAPMGVFEESSLP